MAISWDGFVSTPWADWLIDARKEREAWDASPMKAKLVAEDEARRERVERGRKALAAISVDHRNAIVAAWRIA